MPMASTRPNSDRLLSEIAERRQHGEGADQRHRNGDDGDDRRPPRLQEQNDHHHDEDHGLEHGGNHRLDRLRDEDGRVIDDVVFESVRERLWQLFIASCTSAAVASAFEPGRWKMPSGIADPLIEIAAAVVVGGAELDPPDVADAHHPAVGAGFDDDVAEGLRVGQPSLRLDVELEGAGPRHRRLIDHAGGDLHVLTPQRRDHVARGQIAQGELFRIEPDAHRVVARAEDGDVADAVDAREHVLHVQGGVVGDVEQVARAVG